MCMKKLKTLISFRVVLLIFIFSCCAFTFTTIHSFIQLQQQAAQMEESEIRTIILDAGHGGEDGGAIGESGVLEKDINLSITLKLKELLVANGFSVILTRETDSFIGDTSLSTLSERKKSDMQKRLQVMQENPNSIFVSIHQNKYTNSAYSGTQTFYSPNHAGSEILANSIQNSVVSILQKDNTRKSKQSDNSIYLLRNAQIPAVIVECGFLSNQSEEKLLCDDTYQNKLVFAIFCGLLDYYAVA